MRIIALVLALAILVLIFWGARQYVAWQAQRRLDTARWVPAHHSLADGGVEVSIERLGEEPVRLARLDPQDPDFDDRLHEAMAAARERAAALNSERPALGR
jgi:hypothetical protein